MKKQILAVITVIALVATLVVPNWNSSKADNGAVDNFVDPTASTYIIHSDGSDTGLVFDDWNSLENGYFYCKLNFSAGNSAGAQLKENVILTEYNEPLSNIATIEYSTNLTNWVDATNDFITGYRNFTTSGTHAVYMRMSFSANVTFKFKYCVYLQDGTLVDDSAERFVSVIDGYVMFPQKVNKLKPDSPGTTTTAPETTTVEPSTSGETTTVETTTVEPSTSGETTTKTTTKAPTTKAPTTVVPTTEEPTEEPTVEPTVETTAKQTAETTKYKKAKTPGKTKIKKIWKKKRSAKKIKLKIKKAKNAKGYELSVYKKKANAKKHVKALVIKYTTKLKNTIKSKKFKKKKKLFVVVRAYNVDSKGAKKFGPWAKPKKVKVKK